MALMLNTLAGFWRSGFWFDVACLAAGAAAISPFLLTRSLRTWLSRSDLDLEKAGLIALVVALVVIGACSRFAR
ncbi:hypothetical protein [Lysobacter sp. Root494]|uniref:hypothetical protein n=1 Tax=Lysobacter sp. Root494 TaxID=1736549 RepID=UPI0006F98DDB|nr:hypothetical protein [Lysobacter sp. Root494]KQY50363.1 hypothetical protein ASD14_11620 [Lysobacter sp. Root494]